MNTSHMSKAIHLIFEEPPEAVDETWTHGAMLGGMVGYDDESLAHSYFAAADLLIEQTLANGVRGQDIVCPALYLYRHAIELQLKVLMRPKKLNHDLAALLSEFATHVQVKYNEQLPDWMEKPLRQLAEFDPSSDLFRYGKTKRPEVPQALMDGGEFWIDLRRLKKTMSSVENAFYRVSVAEKEGLEGLRRLAPTLNPFFKRSPNGAA